MYHSITFTDIIDSDTMILGINPYVPDRSAVTKNTWEDWHLIPSSRPVFNPPELKTNYIDLPGFDSQIDMSNAVTGYPVYSNREGEIEFIVENGHADWYDVYADISNHLHGRHTYAILEDQPDYYYEGTFTVKEWISDEHYSKVIIAYNLKPYKRTLMSTIADWEWDSFSFVDGVIMSSIFGDIPVNIQQPLRIPSLLVRRAPTCPVIRASRDMDIIFSNHDLGIYKEVSLKKGDNVDPEIIMCYTRIKSPYWLNTVITFEGTNPSGTIDIIYHPGEL